MNNEEKESNSSMLIILLLVVVVAVLGIVGFLYMKGKNNVTNKQTDSQAIDSSIDDAQKEIDNAFSDKDLQDLDLQQDFGITDNTTTGGTTTTK